jgi:hypothetical protein
MIPSRFDHVRLRPVEPGDVTARSCDGTRRLVQACALGAGPATRPALQPWQAPRIEWPFGVYHVARAEVALRACLQLDRTWAMTDAPNRWGRIGIRVAALAADAAWWRPLAPKDAWDAGVARSVAGLLGFRPRRATLIVVDQAPLDREAQQVLAQLEQQAWAWSRAVRVVLVGGPVPAWARPLDV